MRKKISTSSVKWTNKNRIYLETIGILDARTGGVKKNGLNLNRFINESITMVLESGMNQENKHLATIPELKNAWIKFQVAQKNKEICELTESIIQITRNRTGMMRNSPKVEITIEEDECREYAEIKENLPMISKN